jgi:trans-aconitate methyltransferase
MAQQWNAARYATDARFVSDLAASLVDLLAPQHGEAILDLGCGDGTLSATIEARGARVVGIDASADMVAAARSRGIDARVMAGEALVFDRSFDAVFSNAALHWMADLAMVFAGVARALKPNGRFVAEMGAEGNVGSVVAALKDALGRRRLEAPCPWTFPSPQAVAGLLADQGFRVETLELFERPTRLPGDLADWLQLFAGDYLALLPAAERSGLVEEVRAALYPRLHSDGGWTLDYVRLRFSARLCDEDGVARPAAVAGVDQGLR